MLITTLPRAARRRASRALAVALALSVLTPASSIAAPDGNAAGGDRAGRTKQTRLAIGDVEDRLGQLRDTIEVEQRAAMRLQVRIAESARRLSSAQRGYDETQQHLMALRTELGAVEAEFAEIQQRLADRAIVAVEISEGSALEFVLDSGSLTEVGDRMEFLNQLQVADESLADQASSTAALLDAKRAEQQAELARQVDLVRILDTEEERLSAALVDQQWRLDAVAEARREAEDLLAQLSARAERLAEQRFEVPGSGGATFGGWAKSFLHSIGAPGCADNVVVMVTWQVAEFTEARWNPLATTLDMPGATIFNSIGVRNYVSLEQGLEATHQTLLRGAETYGYGAVLESLNRCADRMVTANAIRESSWCAGCAGGAYVTGLVPIVERYWERYANESAWD
jgi:peptidoglycan hydrolase CwlO-like protein